MADFESATPYATQQSQALVRPEGARQVADYRKMFDDYRNTSEGNRRETLIDIDYYDGKQLTINEKQVLSKRGQPDIVINRVRTAINGTLGVIIQSKVDPRCYPRTPADEDSSDVATDVLRYATLRNRFNRTKAMCFKDLLIPGTGGVLVGVKANKDVDICQIRHEELFWDPRSRREDFKDALYMGIAKWMYTTQVKKMYPETFTENMRFSAVEGIGGMVDESFEDRPRNQGAWLDAKNQRVMVVEVYHQYDGVWQKCVFWGGGIMEEGESPYLDDEGHPCNPMELMTAYVDRDNNRYGIVRDMRDIQDEINKRRSKLLHLVNSHQIQARDPSAIEVNADEARKEAARPDGVIPYGWEVVRTTDMSAGQMQLLAEAKNEMERLGPNPAVLGRQGSDTSGRALLARQQAGLIELAIHLDTLDDWELRVYHQVWWRAQQYWDEAKWIRVTDDDQDPRFVQINAPRQQPVMDENGAPQKHPDMDDSGQPHPMAGKPMVAGPAQYYPEHQENPDHNPEDPESPQTVPHPQAGESVFGYDNKIAETDIDIIIDTTPQTANIMQEILQDLIKLVSASPAYAAQVPFELFLELSPVPRKRQLIDKLRKYQQEQQQAQSQQQQMQQGAAMEKLKAEIQEMHASSFAKIIAAVGQLARGGAMDDANKIAADAAATSAAAELHSSITDEQTHQRELAAQQQQAQQHDAEMQQAAAEPAPSGQDG